ncbi:D-alanyl-D-alanine carboxypeptidase/D-alanyl-D-alanine-endopeptidase [uncultured Cellulomonas sp.]|uniref:D-alanyl-D-alanine carboxypeptidase/D-alanyl-D-alanine endopeptidase n=1 Tax=uncultured Cellulomonas sp. TaxID=189682 RepID=UPI00261D5ABC|nr:D-alanyl-D-alanine carboxypeptidase/D-alanyl-D-alanine-endopeptidase [uncultured Cellulomonas sp.]
MGRAARATGVSALVLLVAAGGYATADAVDLVPGVLTLAPVPPPPEPFPTAPGAVPAPDLAAALPALDDAAPVPAAGPLAQSVAELVTDPRVGPSIGVVVADLLTGEVLASHEPEVPRTPASVAKVVTAVAALSAIGPDATVRTSVVRGGEGQIVLVGGGDMMLAAGQGDPTAVNGRAGLADLAEATARELTLAGTTTVRLAVDDTLFAGPALSPTWDPSHLVNGFTAPVTSLAVDIAKTRSDVEYSPRQADPALSAARAVADALAGYGITVEGEPVRGAAPADAVRLASVESAPLGEVVDFFLHTSDNAITEAVCRQVALDAGLPGSFEGGTEAVLAQARALGVDTSGARLSDCSGLGDGSALPTTTVLDLLRLVTDPAHPELRGVAVGMPLAGYSGTLADRFTRSSAAGLVRAKTGSLSGVTSLAGTVVDADGRALLFAVLADATPPGGQPAPRAAIDAFVARLAACGCR